MPSTTIAGVAIRGLVTPASAGILTPEALTFPGELHRRFEAPRVERLAARVKVQDAIDGGALPDFPAETADIRAKGWTVAPIPIDLEDRRVEITGCRPVSGIDARREPVYRREVQPGGQAL
jgi:malate synthase